MNGPGLHGYSEFIIQNGLIRVAELRVWDAKNFGPVSPWTHRSKFVKAITANGMARFLLCRWSIGSIHEVWWLHVLCTFHFRLMMYELSYKMPCQWLLLFLLYLKQPLRTPAVVVVLVHQPTGKYFNL